FYTPIQASTPHIYLSALPFSPEKSIVHQRCSILLQNRIEILNNLESWNRNNFTIHVDQATCMTFQPGSNVLYIGTSIGTLESWDGYSEQQIFQPIGSHKATITGLAITTDNQCLISSSRDGAIIIWNIKTEQRVWGPFICHTNSLNSISIFSDGSKVVTGGKDGTIRVWKISHEDIASDLCSFTNIDKDEFPLKVQFLQHPSSFSSGLNITADGWLTSQDQLILWVPSWYRQSLISPQVLCVQPLAENQTLNLDWSKFLYGTNWTKTLESVL
ncbi:WD40 repeat-like protein, partial [Pluteus cervinus]